MAQSAAENKGRPVGLLRGSSTRMASYFYAMMRILRLEKALQATIHQQPFRDLKLNARQKACVRDIKDDNLFKAMYRLLRAVFPAIRLLRYCDSSKPVMDKVYYLVKRTTAAIERSIEALNDEKLFVVDKNMGELDAETEQVFGSDTDDETDVPVATVCNSDDNGDDDNEGSSDDDDSDR